MSQKHSHEPETVGRFMTNEEIVADILSTMAADEKCSWTTIQRNELIEGHSSTGRAIRNYYMMWYPDNPYTDSSTPDSPTHADARSMRVMEGVWDAINNGVTAKQ
jgi:alkyl sulfatase BDS1-like metallo-beta-lactamase superfamily hydrolase